MTKVAQADCFENNIFLLRVLGVWPTNKNGEIMENYFIYSYAFRSFFVFLYIALLTINLLTISTEITVLIDECVFYFTEIAVLGKVFLFYGMHGRILEILDILNGDMFFSKTENETRHINKAMQFIKRYWKVIATISILSHITNLSTTLFNYFIQDQKLSMPVCSYAFLDEKTINRFAWPIYLYQTLGMTFHMLYNVNVDTFIVGLLITVIAQLDILDENLSNIYAENDANMGWDSGDKENNNGNVSLKFGRARYSQKMLSLKGKIKEVNVDRRSAMENLRVCTIHYQVIDGYCKAIQGAFSLLLCVQFSLSAIVICVCLFRLTMESTPQYYLFIITYLFIMLGQILVPCWFGNDIILKSSSLGFAAYSCGWVGAGPQFKVHLRLLSTRTTRPLAIVAGKWFPLSLQTFGTIMNTSYSFFTLLRNAQMREMETEIGRL